MYEYDEECLQTFLNMQSQLFDEPVAETLEEAEAFLEDCMAVVVDSIKDVRDYLDESGADISGMSDEELEEASEVFALPNCPFGSANTSEASSSSSSLIPLMSAPLSSR